MGGFRAGEREGGGSAKQKTPGTYSGSRGRERGERNEERACGRGKGGEGGEEGEEGEEGEGVGRVSAYIGAL